MSGDPNINDLRLFCSVARKLSFIAVSRDLDVPTTTLSKRIAMLELALDAKLFERTTRRVSLTAQGIRIYRWAEKILDLVEEMHSDVAAANEEVADRTSSGRRAGRERFAPALAQFEQR